MNAENDQAGGQFILRRETMGAIVAVLRSCSIDEAYHAVRMLDEDLVALNQAEFSWKSKAGA